MMASSDQVPSTKYHAMSEARRFLMNTVELDNDFHSPDPAPA
jgi:hypothetical protein